MVTYLLALLFATDNQLGSEIAESISFFLTQKVLKLSNVHKFLVDPVTTQQIFEEHDALFRTSLPAFWALLPSQIGSFHFCLKWRLILFACEHSAAEIFLIWDALFLRKDKLETFFAHLTMAHLRQMRVAPGLNVLEQIQNWEKWDCERIVRESVQTFEPVRLNPFVLAGAFLFAIVLVGFWLRARGARDDIVGRKRQIWAGFRSRGSGSV
jgi:hypothetical protein